MESFDAASAREFPADSVVTGHRRRPPERAEVLRSVRARVRGRAIRWSERAAQGAAKENASCAAAIFCRRPSPLVPQP